MRSRARLLVGTLGILIAVSFSWDAHAFGRSAPKPDPVPSSAPSPEPSALPSALPSPEPSALPSPEPSASPSPDPSPTPAPIQLGQIVIGGPGCPDAATDIAVSTDGRNIALQTNAFVAALSQTAGVTR